MDALQSLRQKLKDLEVDGFLVPRSDEYQNESVPPEGDRLPWLCKFQGSAGLGVVLEKKAALFVDGRYVLEAKALLNPKDWEVHNTKDVSPLEWIEANMPSESVLGFDPWLHSIIQQETYVKTLGSKILFKALEVNPIDGLWAARPPSSLFPIVSHPLEYAGQSSKEKRELIGKTLQAQELTACVLTDLESLAWLLNIRGFDVPNTPLVLGRGIIYATGEVHFYTDPSKASAGIRAFLGAEIKIFPHESFKQDLQALKNFKVGYDPRSSYKILRLLEDAGAQPFSIKDPCIPLKALKNKTELSGMIQCHIQDGAALSNFLSWLCSQALGSLTEIEAAQKLLEFRSQASLFQGPSFTTIPGAGPHGAIIHYHPTPESNRTLREGDLFLLDSGGQYLNGTTDVTRTVYVGRMTQPTPQEKKHFTLVLKGHINLARARFPKGHTTGHALDVLARNALWQHGLDYDHGTGHGVGSYLNVHEGPQSISSRPGGAILEESMILSNEPGYYLEGHYGIRIESLVAVISHGKQWLGFQTLTCVPIDLRLIDKSLLEEAEIIWLNKYHHWVYETLKDTVLPETLPWLLKNTRPL